MNAPKAAAVHHRIPRFFALLSALGVWAALALAGIAGMLVAPGPAGAQELTEARRVAVARRLQQSTVSVIAGPSTGSGFVVGRERLIVTNAHVVQPAGGRGRRVQVRFGSGTTLQATIVEIDESHDLAILEVIGTVPSPPLELGDSDRVQVGQTVLAFGSPYGLDGTLTEGIVSARRDVPGIGGTTARRLIQTDAPINPGNSGGPLVDRRGRVIGVNTAILSRSGGSHGIGFAVPSNYVAGVLDRIREARRLAARTGRAPDVVTTADATTAADRPGTSDTSSDRTEGTSAPTRGETYLGVIGEDWEEGGFAGVRVQRTEPGSPAHRAGLLGSSDAPPPLVVRLGIPWSGHVITAVDGVPVRTMRELDQLIARRAPGTTVRLSVVVGAGFLRGETSATLAARP
jgi:putative serine protease PepD